MRKQIIPNQREACLGSQGLFRQAGIFHLNPPTQFTGSNFSISVKSICKVLKTAVMNCSLLRARCRSVSVTDLTEVSPRLITTKISCTLFTVLTMDTAIIPGAPKKRPTFDLMLS